MELKPRVVIDFETRSEVDLPNEGLMKYAKHESTAVLMLGYKYEDQPAELWLPSNPIPEVFKYPEEFRIYAFNAEFELAIWNNVLYQNRHAKMLNLKDITCIQALCARYGLPQSMGKAAEVLKTQVRKDASGMMLIKHFCIPPFPTEYTGPRWEQFKSYCLDDVRAEENILDALPATKLSEEERWVWEQTVLMNLKGIPIDAPSVKQIRRIAEQYKKAHFELLPELTDGTITKITQTQRIVKYAQSKGVNLPDCKVGTVAEFLLRDDLPDDILQLLEMRAAIGMSSTGKYKRMEDMTHDGRVHYNQRYYGAATGRWTGTGIQLLNLPRASVPDPEMEISKFFNGDIAEENPIKSARALIRPMVKAPSNNTLLVADYSAIEYVIIEWLADNQAALDRFDKGYDQYIDQAMAMYHVPYDKVTEEQRRAGKIVVLGCGFGQGANKLVITADAQWGMKISEEEAGFMVKGYRKEHNKVVKMWYSLLDAAVLAVESKGKTAYSHKCSFAVLKDHTKTEWLVIKLPSGRQLYYRSPFIEIGARGPTVCHEGFSQTIKQWVVQQLIPGRIAENIVQATARDVLIQGMKNLTAAQFNIIWTVYDEVICEEQGNGDATNDRLSHMQKLMCTSMPEWAEGIPLKATGFVSQRYKKG